MAFPFPVTSSEDADRAVHPGELAPEVVRAAALGDRAATEAFVRHYQSQVFAFLSRSVGHGPHIDDLAQEVFIRAYRALPRFELRPDARLSTWLLTIAVRLLQDRHKRRQVVLLPLEEGQAVDSGPTPEHERQERETLRRFQDAARSLPEAQRTVLLLADFHDLSMEEIAKATGCKVGTVKTRLFRARTRLRELLFAPEKKGRP